MAGEECVCVRKGESYSRRKKKKVEQTWWWSASETSWGFVGKKRKKERKKKRAALCRSLQVLRRLSSWPRATPHVASFLNILEPGSRCFGSSLTASAHTPSLPGHNSPPFYRSHLHQISIWLHMLPVCGSRTWDHVDTDQAKALEYFSVYACFSPSSYLFIFCCKLISEYFKSWCRIRSKTQWIGLQCLL